MRLLVDVLLFMVISEGLERREEGGWRRERRGKESGRTEESREVGKGREGGGREEVGGRRRWGEGGGGGREEVGGGRGEVGGEGVTHYPNTKHWTGNDILNRYKKLRLTLPKKATRK